MTYRFRNVPRLEVAEVVVWPRGELELEIEPEKTVDVLHEIEERAQLSLELDHA
jgi:hypothetical protein